MGEMLLSPVGASRQDQGVADSLRSDDRIIRDAADIAGRTGELPYRPPPGGRGTSSEERRYDQSKPP